MNPLKAPFGKAKFSRLKNVSYRQWEDAFQIEFDDGLSFLEPHGAIRNANRISAKTAVEGVELEEQLRHGFFLHYDNGQTAEVSWSFIRELPPKKEMEAALASQDGVLKTQAPLASHNPVRRFQRRRVLVAGCPDLASTWDRIRAA